MQQLKAIRHEIRSVSFVNPAPMTRKLMDSPMIIENSSSDKSEGEQKSTNAVDYTFKPSVSINIHSQATAYSKLAESEDVKCGSSKSSADGENFNFEDGPFTILPLSAESTGMLPNRKVFQTSYRSPLVDIKDDNNVKFLLCEDRVIPQVGVTLVKKVDQSPRGADVHDVQPPVPPTHVKPTHFASASEGNQVSGSVPATQPSLCTSTVQSTEIGEGCPTYYSDDSALSHFDQESSDGGSDHDFQPNMEHDSGPDSVNKDHHNHATSDRTPFHIPGLTSFSFVSIALVLLLPLASLGNASVGLVESPGTIANVA
ncbi:hypothetical protein EZV62_000771 [Acer yangbiense]|uniref:Uncharacterized protein n=1 Tax=Acer yangbiense TaxID=1000413 RepID=A0A5C7IUJ9_9ROSI|nr:hypothetical protein EZV62_000771 [Acer yangbiense]